MKDKTALCIVAHPDDETIWMGGTILRNKNWKWTIFSLCREKDLDRAPKFKSVCRKYKAELIISDLDDEILKPLSLSDVMKKVVDNLPKEKYDYIFTHGKNGEYGHIRHKEIHKAVKKIVSDRKLNCEKLFFFSYKMLEKNRIPVSSRNGDLIVELSEEEFEEKKNIIHQIYGFTKDSFEFLSCDQRESFVLA